MKIALNSKMFKTFLLKKTAVFFKIQTIKQLKKKEQLQLILLIMFNKLIFNVIFPCYLL